MQTYRVFDCSLAEDDPSDVVFFGPRWLARLMAWWFSLGGGYWDYEAESLYRRAHELQTANPRAFPATHFITLWRRAGLADRQSGMHWVGYESF